MIFRDEYRRSDVHCRAWAASELQLLARAVAERGTDWQAIREAHFPKRNQNQIKCKYNYLRRCGKLPLLGPPAEAQTPATDEAPFDDLFDADRLPFFDFAE